MPIAKVVTDNNLPYKIVQANLQRSKLATEELLLEATNSHISIALLQEPYVGGIGEVRGYRGLRIYQNTGLKRGIVKAAIAILDNKLDITQYPELTTDNIVVIRIQTKAWTITLVSFYFEPNQPIEPYLFHIQKIYQKLGPHKIIIAGDANAKSTWWNNWRDDTRGETVCGTIDALGLHILNMGDTPTFDTIRGGKRYTSYIDITVCSPDMLNLINDWCVKESITSSDHNAITFNINLQKSIGIKIQRTTRIYNTRKANWIQFHEKLAKDMSENKLTVQELQQIDTTQKLDRIIETFTETITQTCRQTIPHKKQTDTLTLPWWSQELADMKKQVATKRRRIKNAAPIRRDMVVKLYLEQKEKYEIAVKNAQTDKWKEFCSKQDKEGVWESIYRIITKTTKREEDALLTDGGRVLDAVESTKLLANTFYSEDKEEDDDIEHRILRIKAQQINEIYHDTTQDPPFTMLELNTVVESFNPKKAPGSDGFTADICMHAINNDPQYFLALLNQCLAYHHFPTIWKVATIVVLKKPGKSDYTAPKSYRPIGLLPVLGKIYEKLLITRLKFYILPQISKYQFGFMPQKGTDDSLYTLMKHIQMKLNQKKIIIIVSLDIEGAFDSAWWPIIKLRLADSKCPINLRETINSYLNNRYVNVRYAGMEYNKKTTKGCIQGSIGGPILWNLLINPLLLELEQKQVYCQAFADDIILVFDGESATEIEKYANVTLRHVWTWGVRNKLKFAPQKTNAMLVTNKLNYDVPRLDMGGTDIGMSRELKILGLTIDHKLNFNTHVAAICKKAINIYNQLARAARVSWGLNSEVIRVIYIAAVEPVLLYAACAWSSAVTKVYIKKQLNVIQRSFAQKICRAYRTVSLNSALVLAGILPIDLRIDEVARLYEAKRGVSLPLLSGWEVEQMAPMIYAPHPAENFKIEFNNLINEIDYSITKDLDIRIFTDGSKIEDKVGAAISVWNREAETKAIKLAMPYFCTVYQAELLALCKAAEEIEKRTDITFGIFSDSMSALQTIININSPHPLAIKTRKILKKCKDQNKRVSLFWIKAHIGLEGNERADELAKEAALKLKTKPIYDKCPVSFVKHNIRRATLDEWNKRYKDSNTGQITKLFFPDIITAYPIIKKITITQTMTQMFTGHGGFSSYLYRFKCKDSPSCICDPNKDETVTHLLVECPIYAKERYILQQKIETDIKERNLHIIINSPDRNIFLKYCEEIIQKVIKRNK